MVVWENLAPRKLERHYRRLTWLAGALAVVFGVLWARLFWMQVLKGPYYLALSQGNSIRIVPQRAPRGLILDRNLNVLVENAPSLSVGLTPEPLLKHPEAAEQVIGLLASLLKVDAQTIRKKFEEQASRPFEPVVLATDVDRSLVARIEELRDRLPGVAILADSKREYPGSPDAVLAPHELGYVGEITDAELNSLSARGYRPGDLVGQAGLEKVYDGDLKGDDGGLQIRVDSEGRQLGVLYQLKPIPGNNLVLTLDARLQRAAQQAMAGLSGAVVAMDPRDGEILAMVSEPEFDPGLFAGRVSERAWRDLVDDDRYPMENRAVCGLYPPGSVFKIVTAAAGLETGSITPDTVFNCQGIFWISTWPYRCWKETGHGDISLHRAIVESCDIYFYHVGLKTKVEALSRYARQFGLGAPTGVDLPDEAAGLVPDAEWKERTQHIPWFPGNTVMMSIGQGYLLATPLQLAQMTAAVANGGYLYRPHLVRRITDPQGHVLETVKPDLERKVGVSDATLRIIQEGLVDAVNAPGGTGWRARVPGVVVAGKTGTAQNPHGEDHANFVGYAPAENPQIVVAVVVENGGEGGLTAAPVAQKVFAAYFGK